MIILKTFVEKVNFLLISILIILILSFSSICLGANSDYLTDYLRQTSRLNNIINTNIDNDNNTRFTYEYLCNYVDNYPSLYCGFANNNNTLNIRPCYYLTNFNLSNNGISCNNNSIEINYYQIRFDNTNTNIIIRQGTTNRNTSTNFNYGGFAIGNYGQLNGAVRGFQKENYFNFSGASGRITQGFIDSTIDSYFKIGEVNIGVEVNQDTLNAKLYSYDAFNSGDESFYNLNQIVDLVYNNTDIMNNYNVYARKELITKSSDYIIRIYSGSTLIGQSRGAYIVVLNSSGGSSGIIVVPSGDSGLMTNTSGEVTGNVDMTGVQNRLDGVNQNLGVINDSIKAVPGEVAKEFYNSGDSSGDNKGIIQKIYDDLFTIDDEFIKDKVDELGEDMGISGEYLKESTEMILSVYDETKKGDFIISWAPFYFEEVLLIPSGDVNFSKVERDVPAVQDLMFWVRIILSFSCFGLILRQIWFLILATLGVTTSIYEDHVEEENALIGQTYETTSVSNVQDGVRTTISHRRRLGK